MNNLKQKEQTTTQKELDELRARLKQSSLAMQKASKKADSTDMMAGVIKTLGTFEKR
ncbi:hypothetical protein P3631_14055 [Vibrio parahaemolyticus]|uniref:hypothetical protein n=1 Tax=Vibrio parahaemolyticus TaxID=670 RepID=UPI001CED9242|nr:hypothetical protein [Vibrio parahaemolyticus]MCR9662976.1 hypothetical protein [Vibrio parahaemolyticus]MCR9676396.1 hypothetical protein [Vibrio parahaemolyticus]MDF4990279.1 hypothetical protein [Vibrio parahaemolyticus]MDF5092499.1 hypothetical protein [Vibrio parahaemolyticus]MDF5137054.1 hypothetical protein [Vibrio parahaemolyticus]